MKNQPHEKARESCKNANTPILDHFVDANKSIPVRKGGERDIEDILIPAHAYSRSSTFTTAASGARSCRLVSQMIIGLIIK